MVGDGDADGTLVDVCKALITRITPALPALPNSVEWEPFWYPKASPPIPSVMVRPEKPKFANYRDSLSGLTEWRLRLEFCLDATEEESAHTVMGGLVSKRGPIIAILRDDEIFDALRGLCGLNISATDGMDWTLSRRKRLKADIGLVLGVN